MSYSKSILDNDKQKILNEDLNTLIKDEGDFSVLMFNIIRQLVVSPI